jgi:hypothetical protein
MDMVLNLPDGYLDAGLSEEQQYQDEHLHAFLNDDCNNDKIQSDTTQHSTV